MTADFHVPTLFRLLYGDRAALARSGASPRLLRWSERFDAWLALRKRHNTHTTWVHSQRSWADMLDFCRLAPWQIQQDDVRRYRDWLLECGYAPATVNKRLSDLNGFYRFYARHHPRANAPNPVSGVRRLKVIPYATAQTLTADEARDLLAVVRLDGSILGLRDYAFFLTRLLVGVPLHDLLNLKYSQFERDESGEFWLCWRRGRHKSTPLPAVAFLAIEEYLLASGRAETISPSEFIFAPLADPLRLEASGLPEDWDGSRPMYRRTYLVHLKRFGRLAGIPAQKLTLRTLRHTAVIARLGAGAGVPQLRHFVGHKRDRDTATYLATLVERDLPGLDPDPASAQSESERQLPQPPPRVPGRYQPGDNRLHGFYAAAQPPHEVAAIIAEGVTGLDQELGGMRALNRLLVEKAGRAGSAKEAAWLAELTGRTAAHIGKMLVAEKQLAQSDNEVLKWVEEIEAMVERVAVGQGWDIEEVSGAGQENQSPAQLSEAIASARLVLRRTLALIEATDDLKEITQYANVYCRGCHQLVCLLANEARLGGDLGAEIEADIEQAISDVSKELGLSL